VQGNEIAALDPSKEAEEVLTRSVLEALAHLDHAPTPPTIVKISPILPSSRSSPPASRGGSNDSSNEDMASYDGDSNCHSDEDEDDDRSPVYATCSLAHGVKQPTLNCR